jgi:hypothetical protein
MRHFLLHVHLDALKSPESSLARLFRLPVPFQLTYGGEGSCSSFPRSYTTPESVKLAPFSWNATSVSQFQTRNPPPGNAQQETLRLC